MLEWTGAGDGARLKMLVHHDDAAREYAYGPAGGLPDTKVGTFSACADGRGEVERLDGHQHEGRLEADLRVRLGGRRARARRGKASGSMVTWAGQALARRGASPSHRGKSKLP